MPGKTVFKPGLFVSVLLWWMPVVMAAPSQTAQAVAGTWQPRETAFARVSARQEAFLGLPFAARITALEVEPGARVEAGETLARFDAPLLRRHLAAWQQARQLLTLARKRLNLLRESEKEHAVTRHELVLGEQAVAQAEGESRLAWETLAADLDLLYSPADESALARRIGQRGLRAVAQDLGRLRAPFAGVVAERQAALGEQLAAGQPVLELEALDRVYLEVAVPATALGFWSQGETRWQGESGAGPLRPLDGVPLYDADSGLWRLRFEAGNPGLALRDGAWVLVKHRGAARAVVWVPAQAVVARGGKTWCVVEEDGKYRPVEVQVGQEVDGRVPVLRGIRAGTRVITEGAYERLYRDLKELIQFVD